VGPDKEERKICPLSCEREEDSMQPSLNHFGRLFQSLTPVEDKKEISHACTPVAPAASRCPSVDVSTHPDSMHHPLSVAGPLSTTACAAEQLENNRDFLEPENWLVTRSGDVCLDVDNSVTDLLPALTESLKSRSEYHSVFHSQMADLAVTYMTGNMLL